MTSPPRVGIDDFVLLDEITLDKFLENLSRRLVFDSVFKLNNQFLLLLLSFAF